MIVEESFVGVHFLTHEEDVPVFKAVHIVCKTIVIRILTSIEISVKEAGLSV
jgi:hypothetical protein